MSEGKELRAISNAQRTTMDIKPHEPRSESDKGFTSEGREAKGKRDIIILILFGLALLVGILLGIATITNDLLGSG